MKTVKRSQCTTIAMVGGSRGGNERKFDRIVDGDRVREWVGIGWIDVGAATDEDRATLPKLVEG